MTARAAVTALERDGLLDRIPGRGSFVRKSLTSRRVAQLASFHDQAVAAGKTPRSRILDAVRRGPTDDEARALGEPETVVYVVRVRYLDDVPVAIEHAAFIPALAPLLNIDLEHESAHAVIRALGYAPAGGRSILGALNAGDYARDLDVTAETALLLETRTIHDADGQPLEYTSSAYVPDRYALDVDFVIQSTAL